MGGVNRMWVCRKFEKSRESLKIGILISEIIISLEKRNKIAR